MAIPRRSPSPWPRRRGGPVPESGFSYYHGYESPLPEFPALTHINEAACTASHILHPHAHPHLEIVYFLAGRAEWRTGGRRHQVVAGDFYISRPGEVHQGLPDPRDPNHNLAVGFDPAQLPLAGPARLPAAAPAPSEVSAALAETCALSGTEHPRFQQVVRGGPGIEVIYRRILLELDRLDARPTLHRALSIAMIQAQLVELLVTVTRCSLQGLESGRHRSAQPRAAFRQLLACIGSRLREPPSLHEMAERSGLSLTHFAMAFKREIGSTPLEYLTALRLDEAALRLRQGASVTTASVDLGFSSPQYFSLVFRKKFGATPSAWRRANVG